MSSRSNWAGAVAAIVLSSLAASAQAQQVGPGTQRCGGLFCDMYYAQNPNGPAAAQGGAPGQPSSVFLPCHDFVCGMFGGRTVEQPAVAAVEPAPAEPAGRPTRKRVAKRAAKETTKPVKSDETAAR